MSKSTDYKEELLPSICRCEDRETGERHYHVLLYSVMRDRDYWEIRKQLGLPREALRRTIVRSSQHAFNAILYTFKKYGSGRAQPNSGRLGKKICTRKFRSTSLDGLHLRPLTNDEHSYLVSKMREGFPDLAQPTAEQLLAHQKLQALSKELHSKRKRKDENPDVGTCSNAVPPRKVLKAHRPLQAKICTDEEGVRILDPMTTMNRSEEQLPLVWDKMTPPTDGNNDDGSDTDLNDPEYMDLKDIRWKKAIRAQLSSSYNKLRRRVRGDVNCRCRCHKAPRNYDSDPGSPYRYST